MEPRPPGKRAAEGLGTLRPSDGGTLFSRKALLPACAFLCLHTMLFGPAGEEEERKKEGRMDPRPRNTPASERVTSPRIPGNLGAPASFTPPGTPPSAQIKVARAGAAPRTVSSTA